MNSLYLVTQAGFAATTILCYGILLIRLKKSLHATNFTEDKKRHVFNGTVLALGGWAIVTLTLSLSGFLNNFDTMPPRFIIILIIPLAGIILSFRTNTVKEILRHTTPDFILRLQGFRVVVEVLILMLFLANLAPVQMTFEGRNFDILSGITGPIVAWLYIRKKINRTWMIIWNLAGLALLINIVAIAVLSLPTPLRVFMEEPSNTIVTRFPIIWLPAFLVPLAYGLHLLSLKQLLSKDAASSIV